MCFSFLGAGPSIPYWDFHGSTFISSSYIRLTPDHQSKKGGLWNSVVGIPVFYDPVICQEKQDAWPNTLDTVVLVRVLAGDTVSVAVLGRIVYPYSASPLRCTDGYQQI